MSFLVVHSVTFHIQLANMSSCDAYIFCEPCSSHHFPFPLHPVHAPALYHKLSFFLSSLHSSSLSPYWSWGYISVMSITLSMQTHSQRNGLPLGLSEPFQWIDTYSAPTAVFFLCWKIFFHTIYSDNAFPFPNSDLILPTLPCHLTPRLFFLFRNEHPNNEILIGYEAKLMRWNP